MRVLPLRLPAQTPPLSGAENALSESSYKTRNTALTPRLRCFLKYYNLQETAYRRILCVFIICDYPPFVNH